MAARLATTSSTDTCFGFTGASVSGASVPTSVFVDEVVASLAAMFPDACSEFLHQEFNLYVGEYGERVVGYLADKFAEEGYTKRSLKKRKREPDSPPRQKEQYDDPGRQAESQEYQSIACVTSLRFLECH